MGDRGNIRFDFPGYDGPAQSIFLYSHWGGTALPATLAEALDTPRARARWNDESYLTRILIEEVVDRLGGHGDEYSFGVSTYEIDPGHETLVIDHAAKTVDGVQFDLFIEYQRQRV